MQPQSPEGGGYHPHLPHQYTQYQQHGGATLSRLSGADASDWKHATDSLNTFIKQRSQDESHIPSGDINKSHWVKSNERSKCNNPTCRKKFTLTGRKHHCRRCGEIFCARCVCYQRCLSPMAEYDPNGKLYQVCEVCSSDTQTIGQTRSFTKMFQVMRSQYQAGVNSDSLKYGNPTKVILLQECARLVDGYRRHVLSDNSSTHDATVNEVKPKRFSFPRLGSRVVSIKKGAPDWQKPSTWMSEGEECKVCCHKYTRLEKYHNCRICGRLVCLSCSSRDFLLFVPDDCDKESMGNQPRWAIIAIVGCPEVEPDKHLYLRVCDPCREKLETLQVDAYQESLQDGDETADCMARLIQMHKNILTVQLKLENALPGYKQLINSLEIAPDSPKSLPPSQRTNMHTLAKHQGDLSDNFTLFVMKVGRLKQMKPHTSTQLKLVKSLISCKFGFYRDNMYEFRQLKKRLSEISPPEVLREIQAMVDSEAINSACLSIGQLAYESLHLCTRGKHEIPDKLFVALAIKEAAEVCERDLEEDITARGKEDWHDHKSALDTFIKEQLKDTKRRYIRPSRRLTARYSNSYVEVFLIRRCEEMVGQIHLQLRTRCADRRFERSKVNLAKLRETLADMAQ